jgi:predicted membrane-bound spermidine synthase
MKPQVRWPQVYLAVSLTTLATLLLELSLTRIFSVVFHYHFAFLAISIALFGLGAGGVFSYVVSGWPGNFFSKLGLLAAVNSVVVVVSLALTLSVKQDLGFAALATVYFPSTLPFFLAGTVVSLAISETIERVNRVYFFDLIGAGGGCLLLIPLLNGFGGPNTVIATAACFAASAAIWFHLAGTVKGRAASVALSLALLVLLGYNAKHRVIDVKYAKGQTLHDEIFVKWNSFSRVAVAREKNSSGLNVIIDADAATSISNFDPEYLTEKGRRDLLYNGPGFPYLLRSGAKTLIIGPGGGWDVARALASGSRDVTGVEINPIIANTIMRKRFAEYSRYLYSRPEVRIVVEDGRSFVRRSNERYDVIQATLVDTWASTAAGAFALSENNLYTSDAFYDYLKHLTPSGVLAFTRWGLQPPRESLRLLSLARAALARLGEREPWRNVIAVREGTIEDASGWGAMDTVVISRRPFSAADLDRTHEAIHESQMRLICIPDERIANPFTELLRTANPNNFEEQYPYDIRPVDDNRPFFFYTVQPGDIWEYARQFVRKDAPKSSRADFTINLAVPVMFGLMAVSLLATGAVLALPPLLLGTRLPREKTVRNFLLYFIAIGAGYILIEVALIQRFVLFLGHPTYALTVIIFSMLIASGCGSYFSRRLVGFSQKRLIAVLGAIMILVGALAVITRPMMEIGVGWPFWLKVFITILLIAPPAFLMGMPFPTALGMLESWHKPSVRWAWALNAAASVLGSASAVFLAIYLGLRATLLVGGGMYFCALAIVQLEKRKLPAPSESPHAELLTGQSGI